MRKIAEIFFLSTLFFLPVYPIYLGGVFSLLNALDILEGMTILLSFGLLFFPTEKEKMWQRIQEKRWVMGGFFCIVLGTVFASFLSHGIQFRELGIIKSWVVLPFLFVFLSYLCGFSLRKGIFFYMGSAFFVALLSFFLPESFSITYDHRLRGWYESPNQLAMYIVPAFIMAWFLYREGIKGTRRIVLPVIVILCLAMVATGSSGSIISSLVGIFLGEAALHWGFLKKYKAFFMAGSVLLLGGFFLFFLQKELFLERSSLASRMMIWRSAVQIGADNTLFGIGPGNFQDIYLEYQKFYPPYLEWAVPHPHNTLLAFWLYAGVLGVIGFLIVVGNVVFAFYKNKKTTNIFTIGVFCVLFALFLHGSVDTVFWGNMLSVVFWLFVFSDHSYS